MSRTKTTSYQIKTQKQKLRNCRYNWITEREGENYQSAERKSGTSAEALMRELRETLTGLSPWKGLEKREMDWGDDKEEQNDIVFTSTLSLSEMFRWVMGWWTVFEDGGALFPFLMWTVGWSQKGIQQWKGKELTYTSETGEPDHSPGGCADTRL